MMLDGSQGAFLIPRRCKTDVKLIIDLETPLMPTGRRPTHGIKPLETALLPPSNPETATALQYWPKRLVLPNSLLRNHT
jgi:hypothetical protein